MSIQKIARVHGDGSKNYDVRIVEGEPKRKALSHARAWSRRLGNIPVEVQE